MLLCTQSDLDLSSLCSLPSSDSKQSSRWMVMLWIQLSNHILQSSNTASHIHGVTKEKKISPKYYKKTKSFRNDLVNLLASCFYHPKRAISS